MSITLDGVSQVLLTVFGLMAIVLVARKNKWGFIAGLVSQPFWFITSYIHKEWSIFILSFAYSATWIYGVYQWFYESEPKKVAAK